MDGQHILEEVVRTWVEEALPGKVLVAKQAVELVGAAYESGASVPVACRQVSEFVNCRVLHPAYRRADSRAIAFLAS